MASVSDSENSTEIKDNSISSDEGGAAGVQPRRKRGRPKKVATSGEAGAPEGSEEEEWDFFGELASHIDKESQRGWIGLEKDHPEAPTTIKAEVVDTATDNANGETQLTRVFRVQVLSVQSSLKVMSISSSRVPHPVICSVKQVSLWRVMELMGVVQRQQVLRSEVDNVVKKSP